MITGSSLISLLVTLCIVGLIFWLIWWFLGYIGLPAPFDKVARVIIGLCALIFLINILMGFTGHPVFGGHLFVLGR